ncbi:dihydrofolate reductase [Bartonella sp. HY761]|uniref:dihydrofolate reductase n=1 Tax=Bartonella sp. HY761 TaxID=2979330 RepID=UPI0021FF5AA7|nr:dihydrofolate reductase [Bartonella sp. HY761]UXN05515.1 dihydrofolate reductase [Bartonella sp. HY761]
MDISIIVAVAQNGIIGLDNDMPWRLSTDLKRFKTHTLGKPIIMGRKTWDSIGRPLPGRENIVISRDAKFKASGATSVTNFDDAKTIAIEAAKASNINEIFVIGGGEIFKIAMPFVTRIYLTEILSTIDGDTFFKLPDLTNWQTIETFDVAAGEKDSHPTRFTIFER